jgi:nucleoid DNA-binding protein/cell division septation protein DedD
MDIAKYIGLFLLKNNFCYIHGLGNLELKKKPASHDGQSLQSPQYEVLLTPTGSIDDNLANFIATDEQISISKAANALRDFSIQARAALQEGKEVVIPAIGKFVEQNGRIQFITDPNLQYAPPSIPALKIVKRTEEEPKFKTTTDENSYSSGSQVNWGKIILWVVVLGVVAAGVIFGVRYINGRNADTQETTTVADTPAAPQAPVMVTDTMAAKTDTTAHATDTAAPATPAQAAPAGAMEYKVVLNTYDNNAKAQKRLKQLSGFGHKVELVSKDSTHYYIVMPMTGPSTDTARVLDSLRKNFNPKGVSIYR